MRCSPMRRSLCSRRAIPVIASVLGSLAAAVECEHDGNVPVRRDDVIDKIERIERLVEYTYPA